MLLLLLLRLMDLLSVSAAIRFELLAGSLLLLLPRGFCGALGLSLAGDHLFLRMLLLGLLRLTTCSWRRRSCSLAFSLIRQLGGLRCLLLLWHHLWLPGLLRRRRTST